MFILFFLDTCNVTRVPAVRGLVTQQTLSRVSRGIVCRFRGPKHQNTSLSIAFGGLDLPDGVGGGPPEQFIKEITTTSSIHSVNPELCRELFFRNITFQSK